MTWSKLKAEQRTKLIMALWRENITARQIADAVGATKNSIISHYSRHRDELKDIPLPMGTHEKNRKGLLAPHVAARYAARDYVAPPQTVPADAGTQFDITDIPSTADDGLNVSMLDNTGCWWPLNDGGPYIFCGHARLGSYSYCERHVKRSRGVGSESERRAHKVSERHVSC